LPYQLPVNQLPECGQQQTMNNHMPVVDMCPLTKSEGGLQSFHDAENYALDWLEITLTIMLMN